MEMSLLWAERVDASPRSPRRARALNLRIAARSCTRSSPAGVGAGGNSDPEDRFRRAFDRIALATVSFLFALDILVTNAIRAPYESSRSYTARMDLRRAAAATAISSGSHPPPTPWE